MGTSGNVRLGGTHDPLVAKLWGGSWGWATKWVEEDISESLSYSNWTISTSSGLRLNVTLEHLWWVKGGLEHRIKMPSVCSLLGLGKGAVKMKETPFQPLGSSQWSWSHLPFHSRFHLILQSRHCLPLTSFTTPTLMLVLNTCIHEWICVCQFIVRLPSRPERQVSSALSQGALHLVGTEAIFVEEMSQWSQRYYPSTIKPSKSSTINSVKGMYTRNVT